MDLLKQCTTTVHLIQGYSIIQYRVYELSAASLAQHIRLKENTLKIEPSFKEYLRVQAIRTTEWALRNSDVLVAANIQAQLWLFSTSQEQLNEKLKGCGHVTDAAFSIDGYPSWRFLRSGSVHASDILKDPTMTQMPGKAASVVDQFKAGALTGDAARSKSSPLEDDPQFSHTRMYLFFMSACMQSIILEVLKAGGVTPVNFRTVAIQQMAHSILCGLDISLTQRGDILVSMNTDDIPITNMASSLNDAGSRTSRHSKVVRIAPAGKLGRVLPVIQYTSSSNTGRVRDSSSVAAWRKSVVDFLASRNITVKLADQDDAWCRVRLSEITLSRKDMLNRKAIKVLDEQGAFEWPKELCFQYNEHNSLKDVQFSHLTSCHSSFDDDGLSFFAWRDALDEAEEFWNLTQPKNDTGDDDVMDEGTSPTTVLQTGIGSVEMDWEPPPLQHVQLQDMEKAALLYPTPPDGAPASTVSAHLVSEQSSDQRKEVGDDFQDLFDDPTVNITEDDFSYFDELDPYQRQAQVATVSTIALSDTVIEDQPVLHGRSYQAVVADDSETTTPQNSKRQTQGQYVAASPRHKVDQENTLSRNKTAPIPESFSRPSFSLATGSDHVSLHLDKKYSQNGRFGSTDINKAGLNGSNIPGLSTSTSNPNALMNINPLWKRFQPSSIDLTAVESDSESSTSDSNQESEMRKDVKRVKIAEDDATATSSMAGTPTIHDAPAIVSKQEQTKMYHSMFLNMLCRSSPVDWSLSSFPAPTGKLPICTTASTWTPESFIETAQLASTQLVTSTSPFMQRDTGGLSSFSSLQKNLVVAQCADLIRNCLLQAFDTEAVQQDVFVNTAIQSINKQPSTQKFQPKPVPRRNIVDQADRSDNSEAARVFNIPAPMLRVKRCENEIWELLPPAYTFWHMLDLAPLRGPKTVRALFLYPDNLGLRMQVIRFKDMLNIGWQDGRLGSHEVLYDPHLVNGLIPVQVEFGKSLKSAINAYKLGCLQLAERLRLIGLRDDESIVIYIVNPFETETALFDLCSCFQVIVEGIFAKAEDEAHAMWADYNPPVLQLIPIRMVVSLDGPVLLEPQAIASLCREVYGRCPGRLDSYTGDALATPLTNAIELADDPAKEFSFQLTTTPPSSLLQDNSCLHIAYCRSYDDLWITAAWTDDTGSFQHQASYYMGKGQSVANIAREIWDSTFDLINSRKVHWHLILASAAPMPLAERKIWRDLAVRTKPEPNGPTFNLTLISTNTAPVFQIYPKPTNDLFSAETMTDKDITTLNIASPPISTPVNATFSPISTTPVATAAQTPMSIPDTSTPRTSFFPPIAHLPDTPGPKPTDNDPSTRLLDLTDETCGIILSRRLNVARAVIDYHPALASGYLVKRTGISDTDVPAVLEVNIMAVDLVPAGTIPRGVKPNLPQQSASSGIPGKATVLPLPGKATVLTPPAQEQASSEAARLAARQKRYDAALREVLGMYRRLALLARVRGLQDQKGTVPWHVVVVVRVAEGLRRCAGVPDEWK